MGGFASLIGHAVTGFENARQQDLTRQFADEQNRRSMAGELMRTIALDPTQHPDVRNAFLQSYMQLAQQPWQKAFNFGKTFDPLFQMMSQYRQQALAASQKPQQQTTTIPGTQTMGPPPPPTFTPQQAMPPGQAGPPSATAGAPVMSGGGQALNLPPIQMNAQGPPKPPSEQPGMLSGYNEQTGMLASRIGAETGAQAGAEAKFPVYSWGPNGQLQESFVSGAGSQIGDTINNAFNPNMGRMFAQSMHPIQVKDKNGNPIPAMEDKLGMFGPQGMVYDEHMNPIPDAILFAPVMVPKTTSQTTTPLGGLPTTTKRTVGPSVGGGMTSSTPPQQGEQQQQTETAPGPALTTAGGGPTIAGVHQQATGGGKTARTGMAGGSKGGGVPSRPTPIPDAVASAADQIMMLGIPQGKLDNAQNIAIQYLKSQGIDPAISATTATRTMADKGRMILPLIEEARRLIAANPDALGPLSGRWSELEQKLGTLDGPARQLAGTLVSIYSLSGGLHGWRSIQVADEFEKKYGKLSSTPSSLNSGLDALKNTADNVIKTGYPGGTTVKGATGGGTAASGRKNMTPEEYMEQQAKKAHGAKKP